MKRIVHLLTAFVATMFFAAPLTAADSYPSRVIKLVIGFPPGSSTDTFARIVAERLTLKLGQPVIVDNRPGAGGSIAVGYAMKSTSDGYTVLLSGPGPLIVAPMMYANKSEYNVIRDLTPIALGVSGPYALVARPGRFTSLDDLIAKARARAKSVSFSTPGIGTTSHLLAILLQEQSGVEMVHVPYKGSAQSLNDVLTGVVDLTIDGVPTILPFVTAGQLKAFAVSSVKRVPTMPDVPTFEELGVQNYEGGSWLGFLAPLHTPDAIIRKLTEAIFAIVSDPAIGTQLSALGFVLAPLSSADFGRFLAAEQVKLTGLMKKTGATVE